MSDTSYPIGATSKIITLRAYVVSTGLPYTGGAWNTATIDAKYTKDGGTATAITLAAMTLGTWVSGGFGHRGKGVYELCSPNAAFSTVVDGVEFAIDGIADVVFIPVRVELLGTDPRSSTAPDVNVTAIAGQTVSAAAPVTVPASIAAPGSAMTLTAGERTTLAQAVWDALTSALTTAGSIGKWLVDKIDVVLSTRGTSTYAGGAVASVTGAVGSVTGNVGGSVLGSVAGNVSGNVVGSVGSVTAPVDANLVKIKNVTLVGDGSTTPFGP